MTSIFRDKLLETIFEAEIYLSQTKCAQVSRVLQSLKDDAGHISNIHKFFCLKDFFDWINLAISNNILIHSGSNIIGSGKKFSTSASSLASRLASSFLGTPSCAGTQTKANGFRFGQILQC